MSGLTGLWCFYIGQGGRQWPKGTSADPHSPHALPSLCFTPSLLSFASSSPLHTDMHGQTLACTQTCTFSLTDSHRYAKIHTHPHMLGPCCPISTPCGPFGFCLCLLCVGSPGHSSVGPLALFIQLEQTEIQHNHPYQPHNPALLKLQYK